MFEEEVKKILEQLIALDYINLTSYQPHSMVDDIDKCTNQICQLFEQKLKERDGKWIEEIEESFKRTNLTNIWDGSDIPVLALTAERWQSLKSEMENNNVKENK